MNKEEFNLSEKERFLGLRKPEPTDNQEELDKLCFYPKEDVKEFIRLLKEELDTFKNRVLWDGKSVDYLMLQIDKLAGIN